MSEGGTILLIEDDPSDVFLMERSFRQTEITQELLVAKNGMEAIALLSNVDDAYRSGRGQLPCLILLDLKLPLKSGFEVLRWIRNQSLIKRIPVIVFTSSLDRGDIDGAYESGASGYFLKTGSMATMRQVVALWRDYWLVHGKLPSDHPITLKVF